MLDPTIVIHLQKYSWVMDHDAALLSVCAVSQQNAKQNAATNAWDTALPPPHPHVVLFVHLRHV